MKSILTATALAVVAVLTHPAQAAQEWGLPEEAAVRFEAKVVDILCELTGDCPAECGAGTRQLGLLNDAGELIVAVKNFTPFSGAAWELMGFCGQRVVADGLMTTNKGYKIFVLQFVRPAPDGKWQKANRFLDRWKEANGLPADSPKAKQWFRNDPKVQELIARDGVFGLGPDADKAYFEAQ